MTVIVLSLCHDAVMILDDIGARATFPRWLIAEKLRWELPWLLRYLPRSRVPLGFTVPLFAFLIAWGMEPKRTEAFVGRLPFGNYLLKTLAKLALMLPGRKMSEP
jgi:hypothetical protein